MSLTHSTKIWDVIVIGGGPAGMTAAAEAAALGASVLLLEKNPKLGKKLLITGGGRCNVTNAETDTRTLLSKYKDAHKFLYSPFSQWNVTDTLTYFTSRGMAVKEENEKRIFPVSDTAQSVWDVLVAHMKETGVRIRHTGVKQLKIVRGKVTAVQLVNGEEIQARTYIIATGGTSHPETGSTGDAYAWLQKLGHTVHTPSLALVPVALKDAWIKKLQGTTLSSIRISVLQNGKVYHKKDGRVLLTHFGITGPTILNLSSDIGELLKYGSVELALDLFPTEDYESFDKRVMGIIRTDANKKLKNVLATLIPSGATTAFMGLANIPEDSVCNSVTRDERRRLTHILKKIPLTVSGLLGTDKAVVSNGGLDLHEVDTRTMQSRHHPNVFVIGDMLNIDRPSGGYSLQLCWTTGVVAGRAAAQLSLHPESHQTDAPKTKA